PLASDDTYSILPSTPVTLSAALGVLANDTSGGSDPPTALPVDAPVHGALPLNADGSFTYTPQVCYRGGDAFTYRARDSAGVLSNLATVTIKFSQGNLPPTAFNGLFTILAGSPLSIAAPGVLGNDQNLECDPLSALIGSAPQNGVVTLHADGGFTYTANN